MTATLTVEGLKVAIGDANVLRGRSSRAKSAG